MNINTTNYESWFLDYFEGNLSATRVAELFLFLEQHPELKEEFQCVERNGLAEIKNETDYFPDKNELKKSETPSDKNIDEWLIAEMEGDLNAEAQLKLENFLARNTTYYRYREFFRKIRLSADEVVEFPQKAADARHSLVVSPASLAPRLCCLWEAS